MKTTYTAVVVGTGVAGYNAALQLFRAGVTDIAIVTEGVQTGTSRNTGSDKQTYYKMSLSGASPDSPHAMAEDLFAGGCVDGDTALVEAALSVPCFLELARLGVPFPTNRYGEYVGYQTDHDTRGRATSAGPLTSKLMTEALQKAVEALGIPVLDRLLAVKILKVGDRAAGILAMDLKNPENPVLLRCGSIVWATGGPAGIYADAVYPHCHTGSSGAAFEAGAAGRNLTEWQYGLASVAPRWNVSGTYMQVLPRFFSVGEDGAEHEFLAEYDPDPASCLSRVFLKGYEWPFDCAKAVSGSSVIDLLVYRERVLRGRRVFLDYTRNPFGMDALPYDALDERAKTYLESAHACFGTPIDRLRAMNEPAYRLYLSKGVDLAREPLEISLCAQHHNGGLAVDLWWRTNVPGLFAAGEAAGVHGIRRPGGSALNACMVGSARAAQYIAAHPAAPADEAAFRPAADAAAAAYAARCRRLIGGNNCQSLYAECTRRADAAAAAIRDPAAIDACIAEVRALLDGFDDRVRVPTAAALPRAFKLHDLLVSQLVCFSAMRDYVAHGGASRGSCIYTDPDGGCAPGLEPVFRFRADGGRHAGEIQETVLKNGVPESTFRPVHPVPEGGGFFENVWKRYREDKNVY